MQKPVIEVVITGGTIDSEWDPAKDTAVIRPESILPKYFERIQPDIEFNFNTVCMKDSRELSLDDLENIQKAVEGSSSDKILITHGTYTMPDTARFLEARLQNSKKSVILTGSITPLEGYTMSDAPFNLGFSVAALLKMPPGDIMLCMNAHLFKPQEVAKNMSAARFFSIEQ